MNSQIFWIQSTESGIVGAEGTKDECEWQLKQWYPDGAPNTVIIIAAPWSLKADYLKIKILPVS